MRPESEGVQVRRSAEPVIGTTTCRQIFLAVVANLSVLSPGMAMGFSAIVLPVLTDPIGTSTMSKEQASWIASITSIATPIGCLISGPLLDKYGRKCALYAVNVVMIVGWTIVALAYHDDPYAPLLVGRFVTGIGCGLSSVPATVYVSEISTPHLRGMLATWTTVAFAVGVLMIYTLGYYLRNEWHVSSWIACGVAVVGLCATRFLLPESPVWLNGRRSDATKRSRRPVDERLKRKDRSRTKSRDDEDDDDDGGGDGEKKERGYSAIATEDAAGDDGSDAVDVEDAKNGSIETGRDGTRRRRRRRSVRDALAACADAAVAKLRALRRPECARPLLIMTGYFAVQQFSGTFVVIFYAVDIVTLSGVARTVDPYLVAIVIAGTRTVAAVLIGYVSKRFGRRPPSIASGVAIALCMVVMAEYLYVSECPPPPPQRYPWDEHERPVVDVRGRHAWVPLVTLVVYFFMSTIGFLSIPFAMVGEMYPESVRGLLGGLTSCAGYAFSFVVVKLYPTMLVAMQQSGVFLFYGCVALLGTLLIVALLPETKGKSLREIEAMFRGVPSVDVDDERDDDDVAV